MAGVELRFDGVCVGVVGHGQTRGSDVCVRRHVVCPKDAEENGRGDAGLGRQGAILYILCAMQYCGCVDD